MNAPSKKNPPRCVDWAKTPGSSAKMYAMYYITSKSPINCFRKTQIDKYSFCHTIVIVEFVYNILEESNAFFLFCCFTVINVWHREVSFTPFPFRFIVHLNFHQVSSLLALFATRMTTQIITQMIDC